MQASGSRKNVKALEKELLDTRRAKARGNNAFYDSEEGRKPQHRKALEYPKRYSGGVDPPNAL